MVSGPLGLRVLVVVILSETRQTQANPRLGAKHVGARALLIEGANGDLLDAKDAERPRLVTEGAHG